MAEPARRLDDGSDKNQVYDTQGTAPSDPLDHLKKLESGEESEPKPGRPQSDGSGEAKGLSEQEDSPSAGSSQYDNPVGRGYKGSGGKQGLFRNLTGGRRRKKYGIIAGASAAAIAVSIFIFLTLIPFKIMHIVNNLQSRFYASSESALEKQTDKMFKKYVVEHVLPSYKSCGTTLSKNCSVKVVGKNPVSNMYKAWANNRLENKLAVNYGIEFEKRPSGWYLKTPSTGSQGLNIGQTGEKLDGAYKKVGITEVRAAVRSETKWYKVYFRFKVGKLLEEKYGIRRCIIFCSVTDPLAQKVADQKIAAKLYLTQRVLIPRNAALGIAVDCLLRNCDATKTQTTDATPGDDGSLYGAAENPETDAEIRTTITKLAASYGVTDAAVIDNILSKYTQMSEQGFQKYLLTSIFGDTAGGFADKLIPVAGWIDLTSRLVNAANDSSKNLKKISYLTNAYAAVELFSMYRTYADEMKTGNVNAKEYGSFIDSLNAGNRGAATDPIVGGTAGAEGTPAYSKLIENKEPQTIPASASILSSVLPQKALAATDSVDTSGYLCNNGKPVPAGKLVCSEEVLGIGNHYADVVNDVLNEPGLNVLTEISRLWGATASKVFNMINYLLGSAFKAFAITLDATCKVTNFIPGGNFINPTGGYCEAKQLADKYAPQLMQAIIQYLIPNPFGTNMSGGRTFDMMAAGADVAGNDSAHTTLGGMQLSDQQVADIINEQQQEDLQNYKNQGLVTRLFDTNSNYSPVSKLAMALPMSWDSAHQSLASMINNPLGGLGHVFSTLFSTKTLAAATPQGDPFGVTQYGYTDAQIPDDPETYWDQHCADKPAQAFQNDADFNNPTTSWLAASTKALDSNQMPLNTTTNPCLLIMATTGSDGGFYDPSLLTADDLSTTGSSDSSSPPTSSGGTGSTIDMSQLYNSSVDVACAQGTRDVGVQSGYYNGSPVQIRLCALPNLPSSSEESRPGSPYYVPNANGQALVNSRVSGAFLALVNAAKSAGVPMSATSSFRTMAHQQALCSLNPACLSGDYTAVAKPGTSNHQMGVAIDFAMADTSRFSNSISSCVSVGGRCEAPGDKVWEWLNSNAGSYDIKPYVNEYWHWSPTGS